MAQLVIIVSTRLCVGLQLLLQLLLLAFTFICVGGKLVEEYFEVLRSFNPLELFKCKVYFNRSRD